VAESQYVVPQLTPAIVAVLLLSDVPKLVPMSVIVAPAVGAALGTCNRVTAGESKVKLEYNVPTLDIRDIVMLFFPIPAATEQATLVSDTHSVPSHKVGEMPAMPFASETPKFKPTTVTTPPPVAGLFVGPANVRTGES